MRILSIDDSKTVHAFIDVCFTNTHHTVEHAYDGPSGLAQLEAGQFDLVLLDWEMPGPSGPEVLAEIRRRGLTIPVIMITTKNEPSDIGHVLSIGATEFVMKPFTKDILLEKIETLE